MAERDNHMWQVYLGADGPYVESSPGAGPRHHDDTRATPEAVERRGEADAELKAMTDGALADDPPTGGIPDAGTHGEGWTRHGDAPRDTDRSVSYWKLSPPLQANRWLRGACSSGDPLRGALLRVLDDHERLIGMERSLLSRNAVLMPREAEARLIELEEAARVRQSMGVAAPGRTKKVQTGPGLPPVGKQVDYRFVRERPGLPPVFTSWAPGVVSAVTHFLTGADPGSAKIEVTPLADGPTVRVSWPCQPGMETLRWSTR